MKKPVLLVPRQSVREILSPGDAARMLASGSWCVAVLPKPRRRSTRKVAAFRQRRKEKGFRYLHVMLRGEVIDALHAQKHGDETLADVIGRLLGYADARS